MLYNIAYYFNFIYRKKYTMWHSSLHSLDLADDCWSWLAYRGSLTNLLEHEAGCERLVINLLQQSWRIAGYEEQQRLELEDTDEILERQIVMTVMKKPWVFARTYFSKQASDYFGDELHNLATNSLGTLIDKHYPLLKRGRFEFSFLTANSKGSSKLLFNNIIKQLANNELDTDLTNNLIRNKLLIRRSLFYLDNLKLQKTQAMFNIDEVFLPALINKKLNLEVLV